MKRIIQTIICVTLLILPHYGFSQSGYLKATSMDVNGVFIGGTYTKAQVEVKWGGTPTKYRSEMSEFGLDEEYYYATNLFRFSDNGIFHSFAIETSNFVVYTAFSGGIKVGDNISRIQSIGLGMPVLQSDGSYHLRRNNATDPLEFEHSNGVITKISFMSSM
jgi:hypothetical protein